MKESTLKMAFKVLALNFIAVSSAFADTFYVRPAGDATSWSNMAGVTSGQIITSNTPNIDGTSTYYFAKGTYVLSTQTTDPVTNLPVYNAPVITTGKLYGGFSGSENSVDLAARVVADKDMNGIVEPWEFTNETVFKGTAPYNDPTGAPRRLIVVTGGEINGATLTDHFFFDGAATTSTSSGVITLGNAEIYPTLAMDVDANAGKLVLCTVRKIRAGVCGPIMLTNKSSQVDHCLIEECTAEGHNVNFGGGAIWMNSLGGKITNSVIRNCESKLSATGTGKGGAIWSNTGGYQDPAIVEGNALIYNCLIYNNSAATYGAGIRAEGHFQSKQTKSVSVINCTIVNNYTPQKGTGELELVYYGGSVVNCIVLNSPNIDEIRFQKDMCLFSNTIYGTHIGTVSFTSTDNIVQGKDIRDLNFVKPLYQAGAVGSPGADFFNQELYDSIRTANFRLASAQSIAVTTPGALTLPATIPATASLAVPIPVVGSIPQTDMLNVSRTTTNNIGAYQYVPTSALTNIYARSLNVIPLIKSILINDEAGKVAALYSASGQFISRQMLKSDNEIINLKSGLYIVSVDGLVSRVIVK